MGRVVQSRGCGPVVKSPLDEEQKVCFGKQ